MFSPGDRIVHPMHGAGVIDGIVERKVDDETKSYFVLQVQAGSVRVLIPVDGYENIGVRPICGAEEAQALISGFKDIATDPDVNWNRRYRDNMNKLRLGLLSETAKVVKGLMLREKERSLSTGEKKMFTTSKHILISELSMATGESFEDVERLLYENL